MKLISLSQLFARGLSIYKNHILPLALVRLSAWIGLFCVGLFGLKGLLANIASVFDISVQELAHSTPRMVQQAIRNLSFEDIWAIFTSPALWLALLAYALISVWAQAATMLAIIPKDQNKRSLAEVFFGALALLPALFVLDACYILIVSFGFALFVLPGLIFLVKFALAPWILVVEDESSLGSLSRSSNLVKGFWFAVFWRGLIITLVTVGGSVLLKKFGILGSLAASLTLAPLYSCLMLALLESLKETSAR